MSADSPATKIPPLSRWKYRARSLERPNLKTIKECVDSEDPLDLTAFAVDEIRQNGKSVAQNILALSDNLVRRIKLKNIGGPFTPELPDFTVHRQTRATATAAYVILEDTFKTTEQNRSTSRKRRRTEESDEYYEEGNKDDGNGEDDSIAVTRQRPVATRREGPVISRDYIANTTTRDLVRRFQIVLALKE
ncbi:hypothetical protein G7054_g169 [Neopestalotiopsis clavispora]|nr:hypothetical protein G7054_g169 [Neopestalotiopsis clavispora]